MRCISSLFYIKPQLYEDKRSKAKGCISSLFYIKPQLKFFLRRRKNCCISSLFYIKPQPVAIAIEVGNGCISSLFYIKPQLLIHSKRMCKVVYLLFSTSNHNTTKIANIEYLLYIFSFLHQTTTPVY